MSKNNVYLFKPTPHPPKHKCCNDWCLIKRSTCLIDFTTNGNFFFPNVAKLLTVLIKMILFLNLIKIELIAKILVDQLIVIVISNENI